MNYGCTVIDPILRGNDHQVSLFVHIRWACHLLCICSLRDDVVLGVVCGAMKQQCTKRREEDREPGQDRAELH